MNNYAKNSTKSKKSPNRGKFEKDNKTGLENDKSLPSLSRIQPSHKTQHNLKSFKSNTSRILSKDLSNSSSQAKVGLRSPIIKSKNSEFSFLTPKKNVSLSPRRHLVELQQSSLIGKKEDKAKVFKQKKNDLKAKTIKKLKHKIFDEMFKKPNFNNNHSISKNEEVVLPDNANKKKIIKIKKKIEKPEKCEKLKKIEKIRKFIKTKPTKLIKTRESSKPKQI